MALRALLAVAARAPTPPQLVVRGAGIASTGAAGLLLLALLGRPAVDCDGAAAAAAAAAPPAGAPAQGRAESPARRYLREAMDSGMIAGISVRRRARARRRGAPAGAVGGGGPAPARGGLRLARHSPRAHVPRDAHRVRACADPGLRRHPQHADARHAHRAQELPGACARARMGGGGGARTTERSHSGDCCRAAPRAHSPRAHSPSPHTPTSPCVAAPVCLLPAASAAADGPVSGAGGRRAQPQPRRVWPRGARHGQRELPGGWRQRRRRRRRRRRPAWPERGLGHAPPGYRGGPGVVGPSPPRAAW